MRMLLRGCHCPWIIVFWPTRPVSCRRFQASERVTNPSKAHVYVEHRWRDGCRWLVVIAVVEWLRWWFVLIQEKKVSTKLSRAKFMKSPWPSSAQSHAHPRQSLYAGKKDMLIFLKWKKELIHIFQLWRFYVLPVSFHSFKISSQEIRRLLLPTYVDDPSSCRCMDHLCTKAPSCSESWKPKIV